MIKYCENLHFFTPQTYFLSEMQHFKVSIKFAQFIQNKRQFTIERVQHYTYYIFKINIYMCKLIVL